MQFVSLFKPLYDVLYKVLRKYFIVEVKGEHDTISLDHLKYVQLDTHESNAGLVSIPTTTRTTPSPTITTNYPSNSLWMTFSLPCPFHIVYRLPAHWREITVVALDLTHECHMLYGHMTF